MFGRKKEKKFDFTGIRVMHYEGLDFPSDFPCVLDLMESTLTITRINPNVIVTLSIDQIKSFTCMAEPAFMAKYHGEAVNTSKMKGIVKQFLVVNYISKNGTEKYLAFWGTAKEGMKFMDMQYHGLPDRPQSYSL